MTTVLEPTTTTTTTVPDQNHKWLHPTLLAGLVAGIAYLCWQLGSQFEQIKDFSIYTTPPGIGSLLKLAATMVIIIGLATGLDLKTAITNILNTLGIVKS